MLCVSFQGRGRLPPAHCLAAQDGGQEGPASVIQYYAHEKADHAFEIGQEGRTGDKTGMEAQPVFLNSLYKGPLSTANTSVSMKRRLTTCYTPNLGPSNLMFPFLLSRENHPQLILLGRQNKAVK